MLLVRPFLLLLLPPLPLLLLLPVSIFTLAAATLEGSLVVAVGDDCAAEFALTAGFAVCFLIVVAIFAYIFRPHNSAPSPLREGKNVGCRTKTQSEQQTRTEVLYGNSLFSLAFVCRALS